MFDQTTVATLSPISHLDRLHAPVIVAYGTCETPEFQRQNREFAAAVETAGKKVQLLVGEHYNHFELSETLSNPHGLLGTRRDPSDGFEIRTLRVPNPVIIGDRELELAAQSLARIRPVGRLLTRRSPDRLARAMKLSSVH
jgi:hypothetical protein